MTCDARIRPFPNDTEIACELPSVHPSHSHRGTLSDYAYPGSVTSIEWLEGDRRNFRDEWPGFCVKTTGCQLPNFHHGNCAQ